MKSRSVDTATSIKLLSRSSWQVIHQNFCIFDEIAKIIGDIIPELDEEELAEVKDAKLVSLQNSFQVCMFQEVQNIIENVIDIEVGHKLKRGLSEVQDKAAAPSIKRGVCEDLDELRDRYDRLDQEMQSHLVEEIERIDEIDSSRPAGCQGFPEFMRRVRMTMIPSIGYFLVVPKVGPKWIHFKAEIAKRCSSVTTDSSIDE